MKKLIISGFLAASLLIVPFAHAQTVDPQEQYQALLRQVIALLTQQVQDLQAKLLTLQDASSTIQSITMPSDVSTSTPITINVLPAPIQAPVVSQPVLGAAPTEPVTPESCTLTANTTAPTIVQFSWDLQGMPTSTNGQLYFFYSDRSFRNGGQISGQTKYHYSPIFKATFDNATCYAFFPDGYKYSDQTAPAGMVSTPIPQAPFEDIR